MNQPSRFRVESLFDEAVQEASSETVDVGNHRGSMAVAAAVAGVSLIAFAIWAFAPSVTQRTKLLQVVGNRVGQLQPGGMVVLGGVEVGRVKSVGLTDNQPIANVQLDLNLLSRLPGDSQFFVKPLNNDLPGNVGIEIVAGQNRLAALPTRVKVADESNFVAELSDHILRSLGDGRGSQALASEPPYSLATVTAVALAAAASIAIVLRTIRATLPAIVVCVLVVAVGVYLVQQNIVSIKSASEWISSILQGLQPVTPE